MTYVMGFMMAMAGFIMLMWTAAMVMRLTGKRHADDCGIAFFTELDEVPVEAAEVTISHVERKPAYRTLGGVDWYNLQTKAGCEVRQAPDLGGFTEVPLQMRDADNNWMYMRKRIWMN